MNSSLPAFRRPTRVEKFFNRTMGFLVGFGVAPSHMRLLEVRGRKSGKLYTTPVDLLERNGQRYLVAPRGRTQWVRNAEAAGDCFEASPYASEVPPARHPGLRKATDLESLSR